MTRRSLWLLLMSLIILGQCAHVSARDGDTLEPITISAPELKVFPTELVGTEDQKALTSRVTEARNSGVPLAVRIVDLTAETSDIPPQMRQFTSIDFSEPLSAERQQSIVDAWVRTESVETRAGANDGFLLLVLVPEDRTQTQAIWWIGPNALPLNGLTQENILATQSVMQEQFAEGNMPNGVAMGIWEFSYNIQFGKPERLARTELQNALNWAVIPLAIGTSLAGIGIPALALWLDRRNRNTSATATELDAWSASALKAGRALQPIPTAMLLDAFHRGEIAHLPGGSLKVEAARSNPAVEELRTIANSDGIVDSTAMYEIEAMMVPVRNRIEESLAGSGAMTSSVKTDRTWMFLAVGFASFLAVLAVVPSVVSMSAPGIFGIFVAIIGIVMGWWWLSYRSYTTPAGTAMLESWLASATPEERHQYDLVLHQDLLIDQPGGPDTQHQTQFVRLLRGLSAR